MALERIEIEYVIVLLREPQYGFMPSRKPTLTVKPVPEGPHDAVTKLEPVLLEQPVQNYVEWKYFSIIHVVADLPANRAVGMKKTHCLRDGGSLLLYVKLQRRPALVLFANVVGRRSNNQVHAFFL